MSDYLSCLQQIAERKVSEAVQNGELDSLPGMGRPLELDDDSHIPPELRMAHRILKNSGHISPEVEQRKEIANIKDLLEECEDEQTLYRQIQKLNLMITKMNEQRRMPVSLEESQVYYQKVLERIKVKKRTAQAGKAT
jgi:hypothetical protein